MLQISIVVFREILEIALVVGILAAATKDIPHRLKWIISGLGLGIISSIFLAFFTDAISESLNGMGQEVFNGSILLIAALMISWTILWMQKHAKEISGKLKKLSNEIRQGQKTLFALILVTFLSVLREGTEIVLFTYSYYISGTSIEQIATGLMLGISLGITTGLALYFGMIKVFGRHIFSATSWVLIFFTSGIAAQATRFWINAGIVPTLGNQVFDASTILSQQSVIGKILNVFFGYVDQPAGLELIVYFTVLGGLSWMMIKSKKLTKSA